MMSTLSDFIRGGDDWNTLRQSIVAVAFSKMDPNDSGAIEPEILLSTYQAAKHPDVVNRKLSEESVLREFLNTFDVGSEVEGKVTRHEFENYYKKISFTTPDDEYFEKMISNIYGISRGVNNDHNTAKKRLMAHRDAEAKEAAISAKDESERQRRAEQAKTESKTVLSRLTRNEREPSGLSTSMLDMSLSNKTNNSDRAWKKNTNSRAIAAAGPNAPQSGIRSFSQVSFLAPSVALPAGVAHIINQLKSKLRALGAHGFVSLQRTLRLIDKGDKKRLSMSDFKDAIKNTDVGLSGAEVRTMFDYFNTDNRGTIDTEEFFKTVRTPLSESRLNLVKQAFAKLDLTGEGGIDAAMVASMYDSALHPDVIAGRSTAENILEEFLETFDVGGEIDGKVTLSEFVNYYTNIGASIDNEDYFNLALRNTWRLGGNDMEEVKRVLVTRTDGSQYIEEVVDCPTDDREIRNHRSGVHIQTFDIFHQDNDFLEAGRSHINSQTRPLIDVSRGIPQNLNNSPALSSSLVRPPTAAPTKTHLRSDEAIANLGPGSFIPNLIASRISEPIATSKVPNYGVKYIIIKLKDEMRSFGLMGFIGLQRRFRAIDKDNTKLLSLLDFKKAMRQMNMTLSNGELRIIFEFFDEDNCGLIDYEKFIQGVRDKLIGTRLNLVKKAFNQLDQDGSGLLDATSIASMYDSSVHPDVISGSSTPQQVFSSFLETFDVGCVVPGKVTVEEFINYYSNISESIDNDDYFELMIRNVWHVEEHGQMSSTSSFVNNRTLKTKADGTQYVEEVKEIRTNGLIDKNDVVERESIVARLRGDSAAPEVSQYSSRDTIAAAHDLSLHKIIQLNKRRSFHHHSTMDILTDGIVMKRPANDKGPSQPNAGVQIILNNLKDEINQRGFKSLIGLQRALRFIADSSVSPNFIRINQSNIESATPIRSNKLLSLSDFKRAVREMHMDLSDQELRQLFEHFDEFATGVINYEHFLLSIRNPLCDRRLNVVKDIFSYLDGELKGYIEASKFAICYDSSFHPEVIAGRMTSERALKEFLETFDIIGGKITLQSFIDYYNMVGSTIQSDDYFNLLLQNTWQYNINNEKAKKESLKMNGKSNKLKEPSSISFPAGGIPGTGRSHHCHSAQLGWIDKNDFNQFEGYSDRHRSVGKEANQGERMVITNISRDLCSRTAALGYIALQRSFHNKDIDHNKLITLFDFIKVCKELKLNLNDTECRALFDHFDRSSKGLLDYRYFIDGVRPNMSEKRFDLVNTAFHCLDINNIGVLDASFVIDAFDASGHPDVFLGLKSIQEVTEEWLNNFDIGGTIKGKITKDEFIDYYKNISAVIENEDYFELLLIHAWRPQKIERNVENNINRIDDDFDPELSSNEVNTTFPIRFVSTSSLQNDSRMNRRGSLQNISHLKNNWIDGSNIINGGKSDLDLLVQEKGGSNRHYPSRRSQIHFL